MRDAAGLAQFYGGMIGASPARADEPFAFAADIHEIVRGQWQTVCKDERVRDGDDERRRRAQSGGDWNVATDDTIDAVNQAVLELLLQSQHGRLEVISPGACEVAHELHHDLAVYKFAPVVEPDLRQQVSHRELDIGEMPRVRIARDHCGVVTRARDENVLAIDRHQIDAAAAVIDVPAHQIHAARRANNRNETVRTEALDE